MIMDWHSIIGILAGIIGLLGFLPYITLTIKRKNRPNRASWWIWGILGVITGITYYYSGATSTIWVPVCYAICQIIIAVLSIRYGEGGWNRLDKFCLAGAGFSLLLWWLLDSPLLALLFTLLIDLFAAIPTVIKSYTNPEQESCFSWTVFLVANTLNMIALDEWNISLVAYPFYLFYLSSTLTILLWLPKVTQKSKYRHKNKNYNLGYNDKI